MQKYRIIKPTSISKGILPVSRELFPGDFGLTLDQLTEMVKKGIAEEVKPPRRKSDSEDETA